MASNVITNIESETKVNKYLTYKTLLFVVSYMIIAYMFKDYVNSIAFIPYMLFNFAVSFFLVLPSKFNKGRNNLSSLAILFRTDKGTYRPFCSTVNESIDEEVELDG